MKRSGVIQWFWIPFLVLGMLAPQGPARGQDLSGLILECGGSSPTLTALCQQAALAAQAAQGAVGLASSGGADLPGSASTLGWRTKRSPRLAFSAWGSLVRAPLAGNPATGLPSREGTTEHLPSLNVSGTLGLFDGFFIAPTVGGFGSVDLTVSGHWVRTPAEAGFQESVRGWGVGSRIGIFRESFTLPGISFSAFYRGSGDNGLWSLEAGDPAAAEFDVRTTSLRAVVGKDIAGIGLLGGAGWDRYRGDVLLRVMDPGDSMSSGNGSGKIDSRRYLFFLGGSMTFLAIQLSAEAGWARGFEPTVAEPDQGGFDSSSRSLFGRFALRFTF